MSKNYFLLLILFIQLITGSVFATPAPLKRAWLNRDESSQVRYIDSESDFYYTEDRAFPERTRFEEQEMNTFLLEDFKHTSSLSRNFLSAEIFVRIKDCVDDTCEVISQPICFDQYKREFCLRQLMRKEPLEPLETLKACFVSSEPHPRTEEFMSGMQFIPLVAEDDEGQRMHIMRKEPLKACFVSSEPDSRTEEFMRGMQFTSFVDAGRHSEEALISAILGNMHLYRECVSRGEDLSRIEVQNIGLRIYSVYDACDGCVKKLSYARRDIVRALREQCIFPKLSPLLSCNILFHSHRPYTKASRYSHDPRMARYHLWLAGGQPRVPIYFIHPFPERHMDGPPTAMISKRAIYHLQVERTGQIDSEQMMFSCRTLDRYRLNWQQI